MKQSQFLFKTIIGLLIFTACATDDDSKKNANQIRVKYVEQICCRNLKTLDNELINSSCETCRDSLLAPVNFSDFQIFQNIHIGDMITIEYELTENCEAFCEILCNRKNGIPIKLLNAKN